MSSRPPKSPRIEALAGRSCERPRNTAVRPLRNVWRRAGWERYSRRSGSGGTSVAIRLLNVFGGYVTSPPSGTVGSGSYSKCRGCKWLAATDADAREACACSSAFTERHRRAGGAPVAASNLVRLASSASATTPARTCPSRSSITPGRGIPGCRILPIKAAKDSPWMPEIASRGFSVTNPPGPAAYSARPVSGV
jgi:hypothetical protein